ncbi:MAG: plasmid stabilization protein [Novosphingobium sp. 17-62-19]|uniref:type II toxin-antitoxin system RelE/ParE family toxin n=1 Tax=Novosphingobium sp. 17-62-19 TaxID=1970406 RepID=UPI000BD18D9B|nr:type II toxin-antitoxin system RelE/ParE family toxin [Novosphingobium sp. 17-62-19]OYX96093.1 MAG: plasmid stabilization protein [Novosphingobium sp. 35-62-5]OZA16872.1 MAG: plasmid stabilization protein [Novosphingobium sp. 17-62-19]OZA70007.1 MAG: plasmid stabilization protein [Sphingomonadales bacterium 39-62-4]HQS97689.1 type II toxin-antitoxin system RelE/ParE family toxin [Novosphingobium sp.]
MRQVVWSDGARDDYFEILRYIAEDDPDAAERVVRAIGKTGAALADFATGHPSRVSGTYEKSVLRLPYIMVYALSEGDTSLTILRVIHTSRNWLPEEWPD